MKLYSFLNKQELYIIK